MGKRSRTKGATYERFVASRFRELYGEQVKRGIGQERAGSEIADVHGVPDFWVQTKHGKFISISGAVHQAAEELAKSTRAGELWPLAVTRFDNESDLVTMFFEDFILLLTERKIMFEAQGVIWNPKENKWLRPAPITSPNSGKLGG